ncbi:zinc finger CCCH domain-containing protein [Musa troglodytarum]|uniref:Zinc finger CCCH domain-containing protein n=1 Tax=Musa troglodytarum TaxID=320322 RepID=A0A9E7FU48_9LILI|nr:zinc finger CCCH domain-containing protein [Musa troglodytarum]
MMMIDHSSSFPFFHVDISKKHEDHCKELKSVSSSPARSYINSSNSHVKDVRGGNLHNNPPSESYITKASEISDGGASQETPQRGPRSLSPSTELEGVNKKPAVICNFFARGWCIKGNSCRFLHKKEGAGCTSQVAKEDRATSGDPVDCKGSPEKFEISSKSASIDSIGLSIVENSRKSDLSPSALVRTYGGEIHGSSQIRDDDNLLASNIYPKECFQGNVPLTDRTSHLAVDGLRQKTLFQEGNQRTYGLKHDLDSLGDRRSSSGEFVSRDYSGEGKIYKEMPGGESLSDGSFSRASSFTKNPLTSRYDYVCGRSLTTTDVYRGCNNTYSYEKRPDSFAIRYQQSHFPPYDSYNSCLTSSVNSSFKNSLNLFRGSPSIESVPFAQARTRLAHGSPPLDAKQEDNCGTLDYGGGVGATTSGQQSIAGDILTFSDQKSELQENTWEPSIPFRSSFCSARAFKSSSEIQYDPLVDSIEPPKVGIAPASPRGITNSMTSQHIVGYPILGDIAPEYSVKKSFNTSTPACESMLDNRKSQHEICGYTNVMAPAPLAVDGGDNITTKGESWVHHLTDVAHVDETDPVRNMSKVDEGKEIKESKAVKNFRTALVDFLKELLKPVWKEGHLSKDAHKMIVKKASEKVLSALQPHQIPSDTESISHYLSISKPKLLKLVEGYVNKYSKS